jgi:hypothetical protein
VHHSAQRCQCVPDQDVSVSAVLIVMAPAEPSFRKLPQIPVG